MNDFVQICLPLSYPWAKFLILGALMISCSEVERDNSFDPVNTPFIEMSAPAIDGGSILLRWRYLSEGENLSGFRINRRAGEFGENIGFVAASPNFGPSWQTTTFRDSSLVGGVEVFYEVAGILKSGSVRGIASGSITIPGTEFSVVREDLHLRLSWQNEPPGTTGYEVRRADPSGSFETIFTTDDPSVKTIVDRDIVGNTLYTYELRTLLSGSAIQSEGVSGRVFSAGLGQDVSFPSGSISNRLFYSGRICNLSLTRQSVSVAAYHGEIDIRAQEISLTDYSPSTLNGSLIAFAKSSEFCIAGLNTAKTESFLAFFPAWDSIDLGPFPPFPAPLSVLTWPSQEDVKVFVHSTPSDPTGVKRSGRLIYSVGTTLRIFDEDLEVVEVILLDSQPIDIAAQPEAIWLAYPDRLLKSSDLHGTFWAKISVPGLSAITAISNYSTDKLSILDGSSGKIHILNSAGELELTLNALGERLELGDIASRQPSSSIHQVDGDGTLFTFSP